MKSLPIRIWLFQGNNIFSQKIIFVSLYSILSISICTKSNAQESEFKRTSIIAGIGIGINEGKEETGIGLIYSIGWQKSYGKQNRLRLNPTMIIGGFGSFGITDTRDQHYRITSLGLNVHYDLIKYKSLSVVTTIGPFFNYSRGLLGTGGDMSLNNTNSNSEFFNTFYFGGNASLGLRLDSKKSRLAYEIRPIGGQVGSNYFTLAYLTFGVDFKLKNKKATKY